VRAKGDLRSVAGHLRSDFFKDAPWRVFHKVNTKGDCLFDSVARAVNSGAATRGRTTIAKLRQVIVNRITHAEVAAFRSDYVCNAPNDQTMEEYRSMSRSELRRHVATSSHWATTADIRALYDVLDVIPIVINPSYGNKSVQRCGRAYETDSPVASYAPSSWTYDAHTKKRYILLYHSGEHFELLVRTDRVMSPARVHALKLDVGAKHVFDAVFTSKDLPREIIKAFEKTIVEE
jgi:hypothetical protein